MTLRRLVLVLGLGALGALALALALPSPPPAPSPPGPSSTSQPPPVGRGEPRRARLRLGLAVRGAERTRDLRIVRLVPTDRPGRLRVRSLTVEPEPSEWLEEGGSRYAVWSFAQPARAFELCVEAELDLVPLDLALARSDPARRHATEEEALAPWLTSEPFLESDDPVFEQLAAAAPAGAPWERAFGLLGATLERLRYGGYQRTDPGARDAWRRGFGDCTDYTDVFVALCRAARLPARHVVGYTVEWEDVPRHSWAEVHLGELGWVPFDPLHVELGKADFDRLEPVYVPLSFTRDDPRLEGHWYWAYTHAGAAPTVDETFDVVALAPVTR